MPPCNPVEKLHRLNRTSSGFHNQLSGVLYEEEYEQWVKNIDNDMVWLVDFLDKALDVLDPSGPAFRKCLRELRRICGTRAILPTSCTDSSHLLNVGPYPFAAGGFGDVYEGTFDGSKVCVKRERVYTRDDPQKATKTFCQEAVVWKRLIHPNILPLLGITIAPLQLVSEWMSGGDLQEYIGKNPDADRLGLLLDVAKGLCYLHSRNVVHQDLKGPNVLVDDFGRARIGDFGLATITRNLVSMRSDSRQRGYTPRWAAPEILGGGKCSKEADVFSFAMVMIETFTGAVPFDGSPSVTAMLATMEGRRPPRPAHPILTESLWTLMQRCWDHDPCMRPEVSEALEVLLVLELPTWKQLISRNIPAPERISLITTIFLDDCQVEMLEHLSVDDTQSFVDVIDEVLDDLPREIRRTCLRYLRSVCGHKALLPRSLTIPPCYDPAETPLYRGGVWDVWKGRCRGREVAVKVSRAFLASGLEQTRERFCRDVVTWKALRHPNVSELMGATINENRLLMVSEWTRNGDINGFVKSRYDVNRLRLLGDATRGLVYIHDHGIVHGTLRGSNILIDNNGRACLAGFGLLATASDQSPITSPLTANDAVQWTSPELLYPEVFGSQADRPTRESDCYALGMVFYEVLSGQAPFGQVDDAIVMERVKDGLRPRRPQGENRELFTDRLWDVLELCWKHKPCDRINAKGVLLGLEGIPPPLRPSFDVDGDMKTDIQVDDRPASAASGSGIEEPLVVYDDDGLPLLPNGRPDRGWIGDWLARIAWKIIRAATRQLHVL